MAVQRRGLPISTEQSVLLYNVQEYQKASKGFGARAFQDELTVEKFLDKRTTAPAKQSRIRSKANEFKEKLQAHSKGESAENELTEAGAEYWKSKDIDWKIAKELGLQDLIERVLKIKEQRLASIHHTQHQHDLAAAVGRQVFGHGQVGRPSTSSAASASSSSSFHIPDICLRDDQIRSDFERGMAAAIENEIQLRPMGLTGLSEDQIAVLSRLGKGSEGQFSFQRLAAHFMVWKRIPLMDGTDFLRLFRTSCQANTDFSKLPTTCRTLLKIETSDIKATRIRPIYAPLVPGRPKKLTAQYLSLGIERALLGVSCGLVARWQYLNTMRIVYTIFPEMVPREIYEAICPQQGEEFDVDLMKHWRALPKPPAMEDDARQLVLLLHGHMDGVQLFTNSIRSKGVPILSRLVGIRDDVTSESVKIPTLDPFVVGTMQVHRKTNTKQFVKDYVQELRILENPHLSGLSFRVELVCMICDAPQRQECKGIIGHTGYYACERCRTKGISFDGAVRFPELNKRRRKDEDWKKYKVAEKNEEVIIYFMSIISFIFWNNYLFDS